MRPYRYLLPLLLLIGLAACAPAHELSGSTYQEPQPAPELNLKTTSDESFSWADHQGKVVLLYFGYTHCPDECPATMSEWSWLADQLGQDASQVDFVLVTIDPERDSPQVLRQYLDKFNPDFVGLVGTPLQTDAAKAGYGVFAEPDDAADENSSVSHTSRTFLIGPEGKLLASYPLDVPRDELLADVRYLLKSSS